MGQVNAVGPTSTESSFFPVYPSIARLPLPLPIGTADWIELVFGTEATFRLILHYRYVIEEIGHLQK